MTIQPDVNSPETLLRRIDAILDELLALRESVRDMVRVRSVETAAERPEPSVLDIVREASGRRVFQTAEDVTRYLREERADRLCAFHHQRSCLS